MKLGNAVERMMYGDCGWRHKMVTCVGNDVNWWVGEWGAECKPTL